jgi:alkylation response protein AidB-like acyl-CoA dehydrogenase
VQLGLTTDQEFLQRTFGELFAAESTPARVRAAEATGFDPDLWTHLIDTGALAIRVPEQFGGAGAGLLDAAVLAEQSGRWLASAPLVEAIVTAALVAQLAGDRPRALLEEILTGQSVVTLSLHEAGAAASQLVPGGSVANAVLALDGDELLLVRRPHGAPPRPLPNLGASPLGRWRLDSPPAGGERLTLARGAAATRAYRAAREEWRLLTAAALTGLGQRALEIGAEYAKSRIQFDRPIGAFQAIAHPFADAATTISASQMLVRYAIWSIATAQPEAPARICFAFVAASESAAFATAHALHVHGGYGVSLEYDIQLYFRRAKTWALAAGDPRDELLRAASHLWNGAEPMPLPDAGTCTLDFGLGTAAERLAAEARRFFERELTPDLRAKANHSWDGHDWRFQKRLAAAGFLFPHWPCAYGGREASPLETTALWEEYHRAGWTTHAVATTGMVGATLMHFAAEELKREVLPRVLAGEAIISLGYTEPSSGSDVAAAQMRAVRDGEHWIIDGQKMFTSGANLAQYVFLLTRTDPNVPKHRGLTMFLVPLDTEGIEIHPVHTLSGERTNVTYYGGVRIPDRYRVGPVNEGWSVVGYALAIEHGVGGGTAGIYALHLRDLLEKALGWARSAERCGRPALVDARVRERLARVALHAEMAFLLARRALWHGSSGHPSRGEGPMNKLFGTEMLCADGCDLLDLMAPDSLLLAGVEGSAADGEAQFAYRLGAAATIYGGSSEIIRSLIAQQALGLPRSRS